jgi:hypothetical protein
MSVINRPIFLEAVGQKTPTPAPPQEQDMSLVLRDGSVINEALVDAQHRLKARLVDAAKLYLHALHKATEDQMKELHDAGNSLTPAELRVALQGRFGHVMEDEQQAFKVWEKALEVFDLGAKDLDAWVSAAKAADKFRP